jgi:hypothetical protein
MNLLVMSSEVENGAAGEAATWTGRLEAEQTGSERITSLDFPTAEIARDSSAALRSARNDNWLEEAFELRVSSFIRHSSLVIRHYV